MTTIVVAATIVVMVNAQTTTASTVSPAAIPCPRDCGATGWERSNWEDDHLTGRYEPACACCGDEGRLVFADVRDRALEGHTVPAGIPAAWSVAIYAELVEGDPENAADAARLIGLELPATLAKTTTNPASTTQAA